MRRAALAVLLSSCLASAAAAQIVPPQNSKPGATPKTDTIPPARDITYPGTIQLTVDATDVTRAIFKVHEHVPIAGPGDFVMLYPEWLPGRHSDEGQINKVAGFTASAKGTPLKWVRDNLDVYAFHIAVPPGVSAIDVDFQYLSPTAGNQGRVVATPDMASIEWIANSMANGGPSPQLLVHDGGLYRTVTLDWHGGLRYPKLEKTGKGPGTLDALLAPR